MNDKMHTYSGKYFTHIPQILSPGELPLHYLLKACQTLHFQKCLLFNLHIESISKDVPGASFDIAELSGLFLGRMMNSISSQEVSTIETSTKELKLNPS